MPRTGLGVTRKRKLGIIWDPSQITTGLWLDAMDEDTITESSNLVSQWDDKSGNANHVSQGVGAQQPTLNGDTIEFVNGDNLIKFTQVNCLDSGGEHLVMMVHDIIDPSTSTSAFFNIFRNYETTQDRRPLVFYDRANETINHSIKTSAGASVTTPVAATANAGKSVISFSQQSGNNKVYIDGDEKNSIAGTADTGTTASLVQVGDVSNQNLTIKVNEVIIVIGTVTTETRQKLEGYLAHKWGLEGSLPVGHPYKNYRPTV